MNFFKWYVFFIFLFLFSACKPQNAELEFTSFYGKSNEPQSLPSPIVIPNQIPQVASNGSTSIHVGNGYAGLSVKVYSDSNCSVEAGSAVMPGTDFNVPVTMPRSVVFYYAKFFDTNGNQSSCSSTSVKVINCDPNAFPFGAGSGTQDNPYTICSTQQFQNINDNLQSFFEQALNLDFSLNFYSGASCINNSFKIDNFAGSYDGNGFSISKFCYNKNSGYNIGLFGSTASNSNVVIKNLKLDYFYLNGSNRIGAVVGSCNGNCIIENIDVSSVIISGNGDGDRIGGIIGEMYSNSGSIQMSKVKVISGAISGNGSSGSYIGGLAGYLDASNDSKIYQSWNKADVSGYSLVGGIVGYNCTHCTIEEVYNTGNVSGTYNVAGFVAKNYGTIKNSYVGEITVNATTYGAAGFSYITYTNSIIQSYSKALSISTTGGAGFLLNNTGGTFSDIYYYNNGVVPSDSFATSLNDITNSESFDGFDFSPSNPIWKKPSGLPQGQTILSPVLSWSCYDSLTEITCSP